MQTKSAKGNSNKPSVKSRALARTSLLALTATLLTGAANAQPAGDGGLAVEQVVVTGSLIARSGYTAPTPVTTVSTKDLLAAAPANVADYVNMLPALSGSATPTSSTKGVSSGTAGQNTLNLRNLGSNRTLVLFDGQRSVASNVNGVADVNNFPQALIARVEVVTGGASATYGSDAVAGVVNFILDKNFVGLKGSASKSQTTYGDDKSWTADLTFGTAFSGGRGHFLLSGDAGHTDGLVSLKNGENKGGRAWANQGWKIINNPTYTATNGQPRQLVANNVGIALGTYGGLIVSGPLKGTSFGPGGTPIKFNYGTVTGSYMQGGDWQATDTAQNNSLDSQLERQSVFSRVSYDINDHINVYAQASYAYSFQLSINSFETQFGGLFINPATNPFVPASTKAQAAALKLTQIEMGTMNGDLQPYSAGPNSRGVNRYVAGASGDFGLFDTTWNWDAYFQDGNSHVNSTAIASRKSRYAQAIQAVVSPTTGQIICNSTLTNPNDGCVPFNIFGIGVNSPAAYNYVEGRAHQDAVYFQDVGAVNFRGDPFSIWAGPVSVAFGVSHRRDAVNGTATAADLALDFFAGNYVPVIGSVTVDEGYFETIIPLLNNMPLVQDLSVDMAWRATNYSVSGYVNTWKVSMSYTPVDDIRVRATLSRDIRAPNLGEFYTKGSTSTSSYTDPFMSPQLTYTAFTLSTGNLNLKPEKAQSTDIGIVWQPSSFLPGFNASIDYFRVAIGQAIGSASSGSGKGQNIIDQCFAGQTQYCPSIIRGGPVQNGQSKILFVNGGNFNLASQVADGIDIAMNYSMPVDNIFAGVPGDVSLRALATGTFKDRTDPGIPGTIARNTAGTNSGSGPAHWRFLTSIDYTLNPITFTLTGRGLSAGKYDNSFIECTTGCPTSTANNITQDNNRIDGAFYLDTNFVYDFDVGNAGIGAYFNVKNIFDLDPPLVAGGPSGTTFTTAGENATLYDTLGRVFRIGLRFKL